MALVQVPTGVATRQIDDFPAKCERSRKGALYIRPRSTLVLTTDEFNHLKAKHKDIARRLVVIGVDETKARSLQASQAEKPEAEIEETDGKSGQAPEPKLKPKAEKPDGKKKKTLG